MAIINKKTWPESFEAIASGKKKYDLRLNDFEAREGDTLVLQKWNPETKQYTGRSIEKKIAYVGKIAIEKTYWPENEIKEKGFQIISFE